MKTKLLFLTVAITVSACGFNIEKIHPHFLDVIRGYARIYEAKKVPNNQCGTPDFVFKYTGVTKPISEMNGYVCIPVDEAQMIERYYNEWLEKNSDCERAPHVTMGQN